MDNDILDLITKVLVKYLGEKKYSFILYGSRASGTYDLRSDYDIWIIWTEKIDAEILFKIYDEFEKIPALIDIVEFSQVSDQFKKQAMKHIIWLYKNTILKK